MENQVRMSSIVTPTLAAPPQARQVPRPWGQWSLRAVALIYLSVMLLLPLLAVVNDGFSGGPPERSRRHAYVVRGSGPGFADRAGGTVNAQLLARSIWSGTITS